MAKFIIVQDLAEATDGRAYYCGLLNGRHAFDDYLEMAQEFASQTEAHDAIDALLKLSPKLSLHVEAVL